MELLKRKDNLTFEIKDVKFYIRADFTARDKFDLDMIGDYENGQFIIRKGDVMKKLVELFVVDWSGVTEDGKPVPYSYTALMERLPGDLSNDWIISIGGFIMDTLGMMPAEASKNA